MQHFNKPEVHLQENNSKCHLKICLIYWEILPKPSFLPAPRTSCDLIALLKRTFRPLNRNSSGWRGKASEK